VGDRGRMKSKGKQALPGAGRRDITALTDPQVRRLLAQGTLPLSLCSEQVCEVQGEGVRYILRRNPDEAPREQHRKCRNLLWSRRIFTLRVIRRFNLDPAQSNDFGSPDNPHVLPTGGSVKPAAQIFLRVCNREGLHSVFIQSLASLVNPGPWGVPTLVCLHAEREHARPPCHGAVCVTCSGFLTIAAIKWDVGAA